MTRRMHSFVIFVDGVILQPRREMELEKHMEFRTMLLMPPVVLSS